MPSRRRSRFGLVLALAAVYLCYRFTFPSSECANDADCQDYETVSPSHNESRSYPTPPRPMAEGNTLHDLRYRSDGLVEVSSKGRHPIYDLIARAEQEWLAKTRKSSKTLRQAVKEYRRRYKRDPPKGFDLWWEYVVKHNVHLPDEYDSIYHDLEPFWGLEPIDLLTMQSELEAESDISSYILEKNENAPLRTVFSVLAESEDFYTHTAALVAMLEEVEQHLPPFRAILSPHDSARNTRDFNIRNVLIDAAQARTYLSRHDLPRASHRLGWPAACPPNSPARQKPINLALAAPRKTKKTFIHDHHAGTDPCQHPNHLWFHGNYLSNPSPRPSVVLPSFSFTASHLHNSIRIPAPLPVVENRHGEYKTKWEEKTDEKLLWRGGNSGLAFTDRLKWRDSQRTRVVTEANEVEGTMELLISSGKDTAPSVKTVKRSVLNPGLMDVSFFGKPGGCVEAVCEVLQEEFTWDTSGSSREEHERTHKFVLDVDGNPDEGAGRFKRFMGSGSLVFKLTGLDEWYLDRIQPWIHYVPVQVDLVDLHDTLVFFRGDERGEGAHDEMAKRIALEGKRWSKTHLRKEDVVAYTFRLLLEYSRLMSTDRKAMSYFIGEPAAVGKKRGV